MSILTLFLIILLIVLLFRVSITIIRFIIKVGLVVLALYLCYKFGTWLIGNFQL
ncbi:hypothetical protein [Staphylococcus coagulans]|uniref:hypothetical protein n=1 Tax=Staphylococcus coagulans TaxID=74706 RepID=UPI001F4C2FD1|nr:hypothetical protein [Staphylococcus coagulans]UNB49603.1 hypothetical protein KM149_05690 [Staphylococcus coagulans]